MKLIEALTKFNNVFGRNETDLGNFSFIRMYETGRRKI